MTGHYAVIFTSRRPLDADDGYEAAATRMADLVREQPGFLGLETARGPDGRGITVCYWEDEAAIAAWGRQVEHREVQQRGAEHWYLDYDVKICRVEREYGRARGGRPDR